MSSWRMNIDEGWNGGSTNGAKNENGLTKMSFWSDATSVALLSDRDIMPRFDVWRWGVSNSMFSSNDDDDDRDIEGKSFLLSETSKWSVRTSAGERVLARNATEFTVATDLKPTSTEESVSAGLGDSAHCASTAGNGSFTVSIASLDFLGFWARSFVGYHMKKKET